MRDIPNAEKSLCFPGDYVIYDGDGRVWHACKTTGRRWYGRPGVNHPARALISHTADTLTALAAKIGAHKKAPAVANV